MRQFRTVVVLFGLWLLAALALSGCEFGVDYPTAPTVVVAAPIQPAIASLRLEASEPVFQTGEALVTVKVSSSDERRPHGIVTCNTTAGIVEPSRLAFAGVTSALNVTARGSAMPVVVTCESESGAVASAKVDLSAWRIDFAGVDEQPYLRLNTGDVARQTIITYRLTERHRASIRSRRISWGDGVERPFFGASVSSGTATESHEYERPGSYLIRSRIEWDGGAAESAIVLERVCGFGGFPWVCAINWRVP